MSHPAYFQHSVDSHPSAASVDSRGPSLDSARNDPFVDPRLSLDSWTTNTTGSTQNRNPFGSRDSSHEFTRPALPASRPSEVQRQLQTAFEDELPPPDVEEIQRARDTPPGRPLSGFSMRSASGKSSSSGKEGGGGQSFMAQLRTGSGWFAPVIPDQPPMTRAEREQAEKERIEKLRDQGGNKTTKRPSFMKRMSSGVEMLGFGSSGGSGSSPSKSGGRSRGQSVSEE